MRNKLTFLMLLISFAAVGQEEYNPYAIFGTTATFDIEAAHKTKAEKEKQEKENLFYLLNDDTTAIIQILAFDFVNSKVYAYNANEELLDTLYYFEYGDVAFISTDPHWFNYPYQSAYAYCGNNPIMKIDPTGMDEWEINTKGEVKWIKESEKHTLFALNKDGNRTGNSLTLKDRTIFDNLASTGQESGYSASFSVGGESSQTDMLKTFKFAADNSGVEWRVDRFRTENGGVGYAVGTAHNAGEAIGAEQMGHSQRSVIAFIHSHPNINTSAKDELKSMGIYSVTRTATGYSFSWERGIGKSDVSNKTNIAAYQNSLYYTYFPKSGNLWNVRNVNNGIPAFIRNVSSPTGFSFGTINTR